MDITLKQPEIVKAVRQYLQAQGIVLDGKVMQMSFSSGRAGSGAYANITIEDADIPGFGAHDPEPETVVIPLSEMESQRAQFGDKLLHLAETGEKTTEAILEGVIPKADIAMLKTAASQESLASIQEKFAEAVKPEPAAEPEPVFHAPDTHLTSEPDFTEEPYPFAGAPEPEAKPAAPAPEGVKTTSLFMD